MKASIINFLEDQKCFPSNLSAFGVCIGDTVFEKLLEHSVKSLQNFNWVVLHNNQKDCCCSRMHKLTSTLSKFLLQSLNDLY